MVILNIFIHPLKEIARDKKQRSIHRTLLMLLLTSLLFSFSSLLIMRDLGAVQLLSAMGVLVVSFLWVLFFSLLLQIVMYILVGRGGFYLSLTAITAGSFILSLGFLLTTILGLVGSISDILGLLVMVLNSIIYVFTFLVAITVTFKATEVFFKADLVNVVIAYFLICLVITFAFYIGLIQTLLGAVGDLTSLPFDGTVVTDFQK